MMGSWMLWTGLASLFAGDFSGMIPEPKGTTAVATNAGYAKLFTELGLVSLAVGIALVVLIPLPAQADHRQGRGVARGNGDNDRRPSCLTDSEAIELGRRKRGRNSSVLEGFPSGSATINSSGHS